MEIIHGNESNFNELVESGVVLVDFFATWCGPCKMLTPVLEDLVNTRSDIKVVKIDVDEAHELAKSFGILSVPTLMLYKDGKVISKETGFMMKEMLENWLDENI